MAEVEFTEDTVFRITPKGVARLLSQKALGPVSEALEWEKQARRWHDKLVETEELLEVQLAVVDFVMPKIIEAAKSNDVALALRACKEIAETIERVPVEDESVDG